MKFYQKILIGFAAVVLLVCAVSTVSIVKFTNIEAVSNEMNSKIKNIVSTSNEFLNLYSSKNEEFVNMRINMEPLEKRLREHVAKDLELLKTKEKVIAQMQTSGIRIVVILSIIVILLSIGIAYFIYRSVSKPMEELRISVLDVIKGKLDVKVKVKVNDVIGSFANSFNMLVERLTNVADAVKHVAEGDTSVQLHEQSKADVMAQSFNIMIQKLQESKTKNNDRNWTADGLAQMNSILRIESDAQKLGDSICAHLAEHLEIRIATLYILQENKLYLTGSYAFSKRKSLGDIIDIKEGFVGQAAFEKKLISITDIPEDYTQVNSSIGHKTPLNIAVLPLIYNNEVAGVVEIGSFTALSDLKLDILELISEPIAIAFNSLKNKKTLQELLGKSQTQTEELQAQQEELRAANEELEEKGNVLLESEENLKAQQEELEASNEELEEKNNYLEKQKTEISIKNTALENARLDLEQKGKELAVTIKYKSEFLANMSHELRTPLNSLLILANKLAENKKGNLDKRQIESAQIIYKSGQDLLVLINDVLDISKVEAGKMTVNPGNIEVGDIKNNIISNFKHMTEQKNISLTYNFDEKCPKSFYSDAQKVDQIIKNLLSNAIKFTDKGSILVRFSKPAPKTDLSRSGLIPDDSIAISVIDTGIGITPDKQLEIFEAFQQADGSTSRKYGGTGLGLSISRELTKLLGGEITLESIEGKGSTFTIYLPINFSSNKEVGSEDPNTSRKQNVPVFNKDKFPQNKIIEAEIQPSSRIVNNKDNIKEGDRFILIIEDDHVFSEVLYDKCQERGFKSVVAETGEEGLRLAMKYKPEAIILDIILPGIDGWTVLDTLKSNTSVRHIPVHVVSSIDKDLSALKKGAVGFSQKPLSEDSIKGIFSKIESMINKHIKNLLLIEDNKVLRMTIKKLLKEDNVEIFEAPTGADALKKLSSNQFDCIILDIGLPDLTGFELLDKIISNNKTTPPIIIYTGKDLEPHEIKKLEKYSNSIIIKGVKSEERLIDEAALFLHQVVKNMDEDKRKTIIKLHEKDNVFLDKKILIADDDMRNVFALSGLFEEKGMKVIEAENGKEALKKLESNSDVDIILMDIMMPVMDGYEAMKSIRKNPKLAKTPIIALTAKAMPEDRGKCIEAGASDYLAKPVEEDRLFSIMRAWLYR